MSVVKNKNGRGILLAMVHAIQQNKQLLGDVDGLIGDGDHGMNMNKGFTLYEEQLGDQDTSLSDGLFDLGSVLLNKIGGSMGPIYGTIFMEMSSVIEDVEDITLETFSEMLRSGLDGLYETVSYTHLDVYKRQVLLHRPMHRLRHGCGRSSQCPYLHDCAEGRNESSDSVRRLRKKGGR